MRFFHGTHFQFMKSRRFWVTLSTLLNLVAISLILFGPGFKYGVDFAGGTQLTMTFKSDPDVARIRTSLENIKLGAVTIQRFDEPERHELLIRLQSPGQEGDFSARMITALDQEFNAQTVATRLNLQGGEGG